MLQSSIEESRRGYESGRERPYSLQSSIEESETEHTGFGIVRRESVTPSIEESDHTCFWLVRVSGWLQSSIEESEPITGMKPYSIDAGYNRP